MQFNLSIIAHIDLPGNYRLIRFKSAELCHLIQPGDELHLAGLHYPLPYFRHSLIEEKIDFLFYLTEENADFLTGKLITATLRHLPLISNKSFTHLACSLLSLGKGLSIAFDVTLKKNIRLFIFELDSASPFKLQPSKFYLPDMIDGVIANMTILEEAGIVARFCSPQNLPGCFDGSLIEFLATIPIASQDVINI